MDQKDHLDEKTTEKEVHQKHPHHRKKSLLFPVFMILILLFSSYTAYHFIFPFFEKISLLEQRVKALETAPREETHSTSTMDPAQIVMLIQEEIKKHTPEPIKPHEAPTEKLRILESLLLCDLYEKNLDNEILRPEILTTLQNNLLILFKDDSETTSLLQNLQSNHTQDPTKPEESALNLPRYIAWIFDYVELSFHGTKNSSQETILNKIRTHLLHALKKENNHV